LIITASEQEAEQLYQDLWFFRSLFGLPLDPLVRFPQWGTLPYQSSLPPIDVIVKRVTTLHRLTHGESTHVVTSAPALMQKVLPQKTFADACVSLNTGATHERTPLIQALLRLGYHRVSIVDIPGEFSIRGGILDIFSTAHSDPLRVEFLGDTIESIRLFDPATQESILKLKSAWILPAREYLPPIEDQDSLHPVQQDAEWYGPNLYPDMESLVDYFHGPSPRVVLHRPIAIREAAGKLWNDLLEVWTTHSTSPPPLEKEPYPEPDRLYLLWEDIFGQIQHWPILGGDSVAPSSTDGWHPIIPLPVQSASSFGIGLRGTPLGDTLAKINQLRTQGPVFLIARTDGQVERLLALMADHEHPAVEWNPTFLRHPSAKERLPFYCVQGDLSAGFISHEGHVAFITEEELFGKGIRHRPQQKTHSAKFFSSLDDLHEGDLVVHVHHGISRYKGLRHLEVQGFESDYLLLQFAGTDTLYVPLDRLNDIQRYRGADHQHPRLDRLGGSSWGRTKAKVKKSIEDMAHELLDLYANREVARRTVYSEDSLLTHEFEAAFDYEETPDQLKAIEDIQRDMESPKPMDRLVCGDVGYGKTEVAMRAAFKAVQDNRQVAVLVPTTLLAQQHYETFSVRFAPFPVRVGMLSRFQNAADSKAICQDVASGAIDILIGTHRLLQKDVSFKNLGLVITDEEQWFGVRHKERLKQLRTQVDVLTLSATPIPRTLQMALSGVRDLSVIDTPPPGRLAIQTQVLRFDATVIRESVMRELARGGQVFYVHNRVETMERIGSWLQGLLPEARVVMAHGQMDKRLLEQVMMKFFHQEVNVLVASAIIQSGLDIPTANTILVDRADLFGLSQLYQLRGRVGRGGQQAYAYLFIPNEETLSTDAQKRLNAIQEFVELGSGFRIAAADLEIRGAGNLLGKQQSGNIAAVGLDLYLQMVEQAVLHLKGQDVEEEFEPSLHLNVSAFIPEEYVDDARQRLSLYKRLSASDRIGDLALLHSETQDRYGPLPDPVERLYEVMQVKILAKALKLESIDIQGKTFVFKFHDQAKLPDEGIQWLLDRCHHRLRFLSPRSFEIDVPQEEWSVRYTELNTILQGLTQAGATGKKS
jgi:transcription-repair coupling factor (superfamily II helicase)